MAAGAKPIPVTTQPTPVDPPPDRVIPDGGFLPPDTSGQVAPAAIVVPRDVQVLRVGRDTPIPVLYGGPERMAGLFYTAAITNGRLAVMMLLCEGPVESITGFDFDDQPLTISTQVGNVIAYTNGLQVIYYDGTQTTVDPTFAAAIPGFNETHPNTAYYVAIVPTGISQGFPHITALVKGLIVRDPTFNAVALTAGLNATTPDTAGNSVVGDIDIRLLIRATDYTPAAASAIVCKQASASDTDFAFRVLVRPAGTLLYVWTSDGSTILTAESALLPVLDGRPIHVRVVHDVDNGAAGNTVTFYTSPNGTDWTQLGSAVTQAFTTSIFNSASSIRIGMRGDGSFPFAGDVMRVEIRNGINGTIVANFNPAAAAVGATSFVAPTSGETWTLNAGAVVKNFTAWSDDPTLALADFITNARYGARKKVDWDRVAAAVVWTSGFVNGETRCKLTYAITDVTAAQDIFNTLRQYMPGFLDWDGDVALITADCPTASTRTFTASNILADPLPQLTRRGRSKRPNVVEIGWTRTDVTPWASDYWPEDYNAPAVRRKTRIPLPGIRRSTQAQRFARERLNHYNLETVEVVFVALEEGITIVLGDVITVTDDVGLSAQLIRVTAREDLGHGRWRIGGRAYDPNAYNLSAIAGPGTPSTAFPNPAIVQPVITITPVERAYLERSIPIADGLARGFIYQSRLEISWSASIHVYDKVYIVEIFDGPIGTGVMVDTGTTSGLTYTSPAVQQGLTYYVRITVRNNLGFTSTPTVSSPVTSIGKGLAPTNVPAIIAAFEAGGEVILEWQSALDVDTLRYEWRYALPGGFTWTGAKLIDRIDGLRARFKGIPIGTWRFAVKAIDTLGQYSPVETTVDINVTSDANSFIQSHDFGNPLIQGSELWPQPAFASSANLALGTNATVSGGTLNGTGGGVPANSIIARSALASPPLAVAGRIYLVTFQITAYTAGGVQIIAGAAGGASATYNAIGTYTFLLSNVGITPGDSQFYVYNPAGAAFTGSIDNLSITEVTNLIALPTPEDTRLPRWATSIWFDQWSAVEPNPFNSGANPVISYHGAGTSAFLGEAWDLSASVSGIWTLAATVYVTGGTVTYNIEYSQDGITWLRSPGTTLTAAARFIRPYFTTTGAMVVTGKPSITLQADVSLETNVVTTIATTGVGKLVQLSGLYIAAQDLQLTPINTSASRSAVADRILFHPQSGLQMNYTLTTPPGGGNAFQYWKIYIGNPLARVISATDVFEYEVYIDPSCPTVSSVGGMELDLDAGFFGRSYPLSDAYGTINGPIGLPTGVWVKRRIPCGAAAGRTVLNVNFVNETDVVGDYKVLIRNARFTDNAGTPVQQGAWIYQTPLVTGEPQANTSAYSAGTSSTQVGPSNSFLIFLTETTNVGVSQVSGAVRYSVRAF
jgi:hypothetical protein